ncbi:MAG: fatty acyl-AMP ligase [Thermoanaerobaculales bacterium]|jgi:acyl-CoA synthetase (AMP-forming)/AMP-acid ligase II|nr:fatty acyl-AMP ligase [Thermoanaerobaculales bacterium]
MPDTLGELLARASRRSDVGLRFLDRAERPVFLSWSELFARALEACGGLQRAGVAAGDRVALVYPTSADFVVAFFAVSLAGAVPAPLYPPVRLHLLDQYGARTARMLAAVEARLVLADARLRPVLGAAVAAARPPLGCRTLAELRGGPAAPRPGHRSDLAMIQFSSGTTVEPKPVALSHHAVVHQAATLNRHWPDRDGVVNSGVSWLPLYHDMGLVGCVLTALERPGDLTLIPPELFLARPAVWLRAISRYRATISVAPNFAYSLCVDRITDDQLEGLDLSSWRVALCGAEPVVPRVLRRFAARFGPCGFRERALTPVYGLSEATLAVTFADLDRVFTSRRFDRVALSRDGRAVVADDGPELASVGRPLDGVELRVADRDGIELPEGRVGAVRVRGESVMEGYVGRPDATREVLRDGWLDTGDLGFIVDGELYLTGRAKDVLILRGRSHSPTEVEAAVDHLEGVRTGCSVAVSWLPEGADGETLLLLVETTGPTPPAGNDLAAACRAAVRRATGLEVDQVEPLAPGTLPRTSSGKLRRGESLRRYLAGELVRPERMTLPRLARTALRGAIDIARVNRRARG